MARPAVDRALQAVPRRRHRLTELCAREAVEPLRAQAQPDQELVVPLQ